MIKFEDTAKLPFGFECTFRLDANAGEFEAEWSPHMPDKGTFRKTRARVAFLDAYTRARNAFLRDVATIIGGAVVVADVNGSASVECTAIKPETRQ